MNKTEIIKEFNNIIEHQRLDDIVPFLKEHKDGNVIQLKRALKKVLKKADSSTDLIMTLCALDLLSPSDLNDRGWTYIWQCIYNSKHANSTTALYHRKPSKKHNDKYEKFKSGIFEIRPKHLNELIDKFLYNEPINKFLYFELFYEIYRLFEKNNLITIRADFIAPAFASFFTNSFTDYNNKNNKIKSNNYFACFIDTFINDPLMYERDLLTLFEYEVPCELLNRPDLNPPEVTNTFVYLLEQLIKNKKLDSTWVFEQCLAIQGKPWETKQRAFFFDVYIALSPNNKILKSNLPTLFKLLESSSADVIKFATKQIKTLGDEKDFPVGEYLSALDPLMITASIKSVIPPILTHLTQILKKHPKHTEAATQTVAPLLACDNAPLQEKTAKLIATYLKLEHTETLTILNDYQGTMTAEAKQLLGDLLTPDLSENNVRSTYKKCEKAVCYLDPEKPFELLPNTNAIIFSLQNMASWTGEDIDLFYASRLKHKCARQTNEVIGELYGILFRVSRYIMSIKSLCLGRSKYSSEMAFFVNIETLDPQLQVLSRLFDAFYRIERLDIDLPLLSTPTHQPSFIDPAILIERLIAYQTANISFNFVDLGIALARTPRENLSPAIAQLDKLSDPHLKAVLSLAFGLSEIPSCIPPKHFEKTLSEDELKAWQGIWKTVVLTHYPNKRAKVSDKEVIFESEKLRTYSNFQFELPLTTEKLAASDIYGALAYTKDNHFPYRNSYFYLHYEEYIIDIATPRSWTPLNQNYNDLFLATFNFDLAYEKSHKAEPQVIDFVTRMMANNYPINAHSNFLIVAYLFSSRSAIRLASVDCLAHLIEQRRVDLNLMSEFFYQYAQHVVVPINRAIEPISQLITFGSAQKSFVLDMLEFSLAKLSYENKLPTSFKKLLELYYQLLGHLSQSPSASVSANLPNFFAQSAGLKTIINKLNKL